MASMCAFAAATKVQATNQCFVLGKKITRPHRLISSIKPLCVEHSVTSSMYNSIQCTHNSSDVKDISSITFTTSEDTNMPKTQNLSRLDAIAKLEDNWNGYEAKTFSNELVKKCKELVNSLELQPKIFPTGRKSIQFQYELKDRSYLEFEIFDEKISCLEVPQKRYSDAYAFEFPISEINKVKEITKKFYEQCDNAE